VGFKGLSRAFSPRAPGKAILYPTASGGGGYRLGRVFFLPGEREANGRGRGLGEREMVYLLITLLFFFYGLLLPKRRAILVGGAEGREKTSGDRISALANFPGRPPFSVG
jgi:hypothetical protein